MEFKFPVMERIRVFFKYLCFLLALFKFSYQVFNFVRCYRLIYRGTATAARTPRAFFMYLIPVLGDVSASNHGVFYLRWQGLSHNSLHHSWSFLGQLFFAVGPWSACLVWRFSCLSCRFSRALVVVFVLVGSNIVRQPVTDLRPESETVISVFLKM